MLWEQEVGLKRKVDNYRKKGTEVSRPKYNFKRIHTYMHIFKKIVLMAIPKIYLKMKRF